MNLQLEFIFEKDFRTNYDVSELSENRFVFRKRMINKYFPFRKASGIVNV